MHRSLVLALAVVVAGCSSSPSPRPSHADDEQAVSKAMDDYVAAVRSSDAKKIIAWWTDDGIFIEKNQPTVVGAAKMESQMAAFLATMKITRVALERVDLSVSGDLAYVIGNFAEEVQPPKGKPISSTGRVVYIWKRQADGAWKIARLLATDPPAASTATTKDSAAAKGG
jgi:uncharacterized protein (TIGR02246 family)